MKQTKIILYLLLVSVAVVSGYYHIMPVIKIAIQISNYFIICFKWLSIPLISLAILSTTKSMQDKSEFLQLGAQVLKYTIITTIIAASISLGYFLLLNPVNTKLVHEIQDSFNFIPSSSAMFGYLLIASLLLALLSAVVILSIKPTTRMFIEDIIDSLYALLRMLITFLLRFMPIVIAAFVTLFIYELNYAILASIGLYLIVVLLANLTQALIVLPGLLFKHNIAIKDTFKHVLPALTVAFWSKSSSVALPVAIECATVNLKLPKKITNFSLPLCITINMNACAAFILTTVLFVTMTHGATYSVSQLLLMVLVATIGAIGNAGVPMGCYTISCALISFMNVPLGLMGLILPCYGLIDMLESAINVWSDLCITSVVAKTQSQS